MKYMTHNRSNTTLVAGIRLRGNVVRPVSTIGSCATLARDRVDDLLEPLSGLGAPSPDDHQVVRGIDVNDVAALAPRFVGRRRRSRILLALGVQPPQEAIVRAMRARGGRHLDVCGRHDLSVAPLS